MAIDAFGLACAFGSVLLFGTNYLLVKRYDVGDGFFFQWCLCLGIWLVGIAIDLVHPYSSSPPPFQPLAMLGGAIWCTGQLAVVTIVQTIGIAKGLIIWGSTAMLAGWACGVWGLLGVSSQADAVHSWTLNLWGLALCLASLGASLLLRPSVEGGDEQPAAKVSPLMLKEQLLPPADGASASAAGPPAWLRALDASQRSAVGVGLALSAGLFFGVNFNPAQHMLDRAGTAGAWRGASTHGLDYVHAQFSGIALASTLYFAIYCACTANRPLLLPQVALPALASGVMWGGLRRPLEPATARLATARRAAHHRAVIRRAPRRSRRRAVVRGQREAWLHRGLSDRPRRAGHRRLALEHLPARRAARHAQPPAHRPRGAPRRGWRRLHQPQPAMSASAEVTGPLKRCNHIFAFY